jgi:hypothetical protein
MVRLVRSRRAADEHALRELLKKACFDEVPKQYPAHLPVEACHQRDVSGGELYAACLHEQMLDTYKRLFETPRLAWLMRPATGMEILPKGHK